MADKGSALDLVLAQIERQFGKGAVMRLGERPNEPIEVIPTGSTALDVALGVGGLPRGRVVEVYGPESSGKTTLTLHAVANAQKAGGQVAFVDAEHALDPEYAKKLGVDIDTLILSQPDNGEQALEIVDMLVRSGALDLIVIDSVAALVPRAEIEGEMGDSHMGLQARLMSQALRKITGALSQSRTTAIFINQLREKIGVMFGSPETTTGGKALKFYASVRLDIRRIETLKDGTDAVGNRTRVKVVKNKVAPPFKQAEFDILYGQGISREGGLIDMGVEHGFVRKAGAWYTYEGDQLGQGKENSRNFLKDNPTSPTRSRRRSWRSSASVCTSRSPQSWSSSGRSTPLSPEQVRALCRADHRRTAPHRQLSGRVTSKFSAHAMSRSVKRDIYHAGNGLSSGPAIRRHDVTVRFGWFSIPPEVYEVRNRLVVKGARQNNLRDVSVELPKDALIVFTGVSGSVKSGLAYDTIFAEGQRRYVDSLSSSARQFLGQLDKPDVDAVEGMSPAIAIDQKTSSRNPRSTVGTITEVNDHLRPLYARIGHPHCPECGEPTDTAAHRRPAADEDEGTRFHVLAPVVRDRNGEHAEVFRRLSADGFSRVRVDGAVLAPATRPLWTSAGSARSMWSWTGRP